MAIAKIASKLTKQPDVDLNDRLMMFHNTNAQRLLIQDQQSGLDIPSLDFLRTNRNPEGMGDITTIRKPDTYEPIETNLGDMVDPTQYIPKPKTTFSFDDFNGALIPRNTDQATRDILNKHKIPYEEYFDEADRVAKKQTGLNAKLGTPLTMAGLVGYSIFKSDDADAIPIAKAGKIIIEAYHGTPHKVDKFSSERIGTGEGAQAYGHGLYFADRKGTAKSYRDALSTTGYKSLSGKELKDMPSSYGFANLMNEMRRSNRSDEDVVKMLRNEADKDDIYPFPENKKRSKALRKLADKLEQGKIVYKSDGNLYKVEIEASPDEFLNWDEPLKNQPKKIQDAVIERYKRNKRHDLVWKLYKDRKFGKVKLNEKANKLLDEYDSSFDTKTKLELTDADEKILGINVNETYQEEIDALLKRSGQSAYYRSAGSASRLLVLMQSQEQRIASENLLAEGIKGIRFLDGASRSKPLKQFIQEFRKELPDDADIEEVMELVHQGHFNKEQTELLRALFEDDFLGFDYPAQAVSEALRGNPVSLAMFDPSQRLLDAIEACKPKDLTNNYVVFDDSLINIKTENDVPITPVGELTKVN